MADIQNYVCYKKLNADAKYELCAVYTAVEIRKTKRHKNVVTELLKRVYSYFHLRSLCTCMSISKAWESFQTSNWINPRRTSIQLKETDIENHDVSDIAKGYGHSVKQLSFQRCQNIEDDALRRFAEHFCHLEALNLNGCKKLTDITCYNLSQLCGHLTSLDLGSCPEITNEGLKLLGLGCFNLEKINISWCATINEVGVHELVSRCSKITSFECKGCQRIGDAAIFELTDFCRNLEVLNMLACSLLTDKSIANLYKCPQLRYLCVSNCLLLTDISLIAMGSGLPKLRTLEVARCSKFTDQGFHGLTKGCPLLEKLDLDSCIMITDKTLHYIAKFCSGIQRLSLSHCEAVTDKGVWSISKHSKTCSSKLTVLELDNCPLITNLTIAILLELPTLERVELYDCDGISADGIYKLQNSRPKLKVHSSYRHITKIPALGPLSCSPCDIGFYCVLFILIACFAFGMYHALHCYFHSVFNCAFTNKK